MNTSSKSPANPQKPAAARGAELLNLRKPVGHVSINSFGATNPLDPKSGGTVLDFARLNMNEMARRAADGV